MLSKNEANALAMALKRDLDRLDVDLFASLVKGGKHWGFVHDEVIDAALELGDIVRKDDIEAKRVEAEGKLSDLTDDLEKAQAKIDELREKLGHQAAGLDHLQEMIVCRNVGDALDQLRDIFPEHQFLSPAAEHMLAGIRGQGALAL